MPKRRNRTFANGELLPLVGEHERAGLSRAIDIAKAIMTDKRMDMEDADLVKRIRWSVTDARRRAAARGV